MAIFGYTKRQVNDFGLMELTEVSFDLSANDLRTIAGFMLECADELESGSFRTSHRHLSVFARQWSKDHPSVDVIVNMPSNETAS
jgi:hypothetical protein